MVESQIMKYEQFLSMETGIPIRNKAEYEHVTEKYPGLSDQIWTNYCLYLRDHRKEIRAMMVKHE